MAFAALPVAELAGSLAVAAAPEIGAAAATAAGTVASGAATLGAGAAGVGSAIYGGHEVYKHKKQVAGALSHAGHSGVKLANSVIHAGAKHHQHSADDDGNPF